MGEVVLPLRYDTRELQGGAKAIRVSKSNVEKIKFKR
jgi:hypothetical protein